MPRPLIAALLAVALFAGCGDDEPTGTSGTPLDDVEVSGEAGEQPTFELDEPLELTETTRRVLDEGDGDEIGPNSVVSFDFVFVNGRDGKELTTSFDAEPAELVFQESLMAGVHQGLDGVPGGSRVLVGIAPEDGLGADPTRGVLETDTLLFYAEIHDVQTPLARAEGDPVEPVEGLPTVELAEDGAPTISVPDTEPPAELVAQPLIQGKGPEVESGQSLTVHYTAVIWDTGKEFDSTWESGSPTTVTIGEGGDVIAGWDEGLLGQAVGSQILLVVPPDKGYPDGTSDGLIKAGDTVVFVVDILGAA